MGRGASSRKALEDALFLKVKGAPRHVVIRPLGNIYPGAPCVRLPALLKLLWPSAMVQNEGRKYQDVLNYLVTQRMASTSFA